MKPATCSDWVKNGAERGVDCGGTCLRVCTLDTVPLLVHFTRFEEVGKGLYNILSYVENPNVGVRTLPLRYRVRLYDADGLLITEQTGTTVIPGGVAVPIYIGGVRTNESTPVRAFLEFIDQPQWVHMTEVVPQFQSTEFSFDRLDTTPRLNAVLKTEERQVFRSLPVIAMIYNTEGNLIAFSRTIIDSLTRGSDAHLIFTWRKAFSGAPTKIEIIPEWYLTAFPR